MNNVHMVYIFAYWCTLYKNNSIWIEPVIKRGYDHYVNAL